LAVVPDCQEIRTRVRERHGIPLDAFLVLFCGKYSSRKSPLDLVAAVHAAGSAGAPVWALLVGEGPERGGIEEYCRLNGMRNIVLTGFVNQSAIPSYYAASDVLAVPSAYDPHPLVVSEACCLGLPVIASDRLGCIGATDTIRPDVNAIVFPWGDRERLCEGILRLCHDHELYLRMSAAAMNIGAMQDATVVAQQLAKAVTCIHELGPRY
jgi:glycosyltransferase involved in cell wall biosynthesis